MFDPYNFEKNSHQNIIKRILPERKSNKEIQFQMKIYDV